MAYTDAQLLDILRDFHAKHNRPPRQKELKQYQSLYTRFGSIDAALKAAGLPPSTHVYRRYTQKQLLDILRGFHAQHKRSPFPKDISQYQIITREFGSFHKALKTAGLPTASHANQRYSKSQLIEWLRDFHARNHRSPRASECPIYHTCSRYFGTYRAALKAAGLPPPPSYYQTYTNEQLIREARKLTAGTDTLTPEKYDSIRPRYLPTSKFVTRRFKKWDYFLEKCGMKPEEKPLTARDLLASFQQMIDRQEVKLQADDSNSDTFTRRQLSQILLAAYHHKGRRLKKREILQIQGLPGFTTLLTHLQVTSVRMLWDQLLDT